MVKDAEAHAAEDKARRDEVDARNKAEAEAYAREKQEKEQASDSGSQSPETPDVKEGEVVGA